ncbi:MAG: methyltransferase domain-containing protein [Gammaproteobacteria bacterium]|nr:methyltransferase domain-containing protein [Gammaproteobacteria bacterium]
MTARTSSVDDHFARAAENFDRSPISLQLASLADRLLQHLPVEDHQHWLDFGAGTGVLSVPLATRVAQVTALDTSAAMLDKVRSKQVANIVPLNQDIFCGLPCQFDGIVSSMALHHVADIPGLFACMQQCLLPGGRIALIDLFAEDGSFHGDNRGKGVKHLGFVPEHLLCHAREAGFEELALSEFFHIEHKNGRRYPLFLLTGRTAE